MCFIKGFIRNSPRRKINKQLTSYIASTVCYFKAIELMIIQIS